MKLLSYIAYRQCKCIVALEDRYKRVRNLWRTAVFRPACTEVREAGPAMAPPTRSVGPMLRRLPIRPENLQGKRFLSSERRDLIPQLLFIEHNSVGNEKSSVLFHKRLGMMVVDLPQVVTHYSDGKDFRIASVTDPTRLDAGCSINVWAN